MIYKRAGTAIVVSAASLFGFKLSRGHVPENFEKPVIFRGIMTSFRLVGYAVYSTKLTFTIKNLFL
jgi:hypothetical protein